MQRIQAIWQVKWVRHGVLPLLFYATVTLILTYPLVTQLETHAAGAPYGDEFESVRAIWWTQTALARGINPAEQPLLDYPNGFFSPVQWATPVATLTGLPFAVFASPLTAYNLAFLLSFVLTGWTAYLFCFELTGHHGAALLGGLIVMAFPNRLGHASAAHLGLITNYWRMLYLWALLRVWRGAGWRTAVLGGVCLGLAVGTALPAPVYELIPLTILVGGGLVWAYRRQWRTWLGRAMILFAVGGLLAAVFYVPMLLAALRGELDYLQESGVVLYSTDLLAYVTPSPFNPLVSALGLIPAWGWDVLGDAANEGMAYLGLVAVLLAAVGVWKVRAARPWLAVAAIGILFALGPVLKASDRVVQVPVEDGKTAEVALPYVLYSLLPGVGMGRTPGRFNAVTAVGLAALAAYGWAALSARAAWLSRAVWQGGAVIGLSALIVGEYAVFLPFPTTEVPVPTYLETLAVQAAAGIERPVLDLPTRDYITANWLLYYQTIHHQPVIAGHVVRNTPTNPALLTLLNAAARPPDEAGFAEPISPAQAAAIFRASGAQVVILHRHFDADYLMATYLPQVLGDPVYTDEDVLIFEVPDGPAARTAACTASGGWADPADPAMRWIGEGIDVACFVPEGLGAARLAFEAGVWPYDRALEATLEGQPQTFALAVDQPGRAWTTDLVPQGGAFVSLHLDPAEGECIDIPGEAGCRSAWITNPRVVVDDEHQPQVVDFGDRMRLVRAEVEPPAGGQIALRLYWEALGAAREDYTFFAHLIDAGGVAVAQIDVPLGGADNPTSTWPAGGFRWLDVAIDLDPEIVPPGTVGLYVGLYTYPDITRLPVNVDRPHAQDGLLYLQDVTLPPNDGG